VHGYNFLSLIDFRKKEFKGKRQIAALYKKGVIITIHLPIGNPATNGGNSDSAGHPIQQLVVANSVANLRWNGWLDQIATYLNTLNADGVKIPILFRPFHEMNGGGNWYGAKHCSPAEFIAAWKYTVDYLRKTRGVNNILLVYAPNKLDKAGYLDRYAGDQYVDVMAFDNYDRTITNDPFDIAGEAESAVAAAHAHHKIAAIAETGHKEGIQLYKSNDWYMQHLLKPLLASKSAAQVAYIMTWTNRSEGYWVPLPGQEGYADFQSFVTNEAIVLNNRMKNMYVMPTELP
jgi:mannan endo-1,4-beta-mannosidase